MGGPDPRKIEALREAWERASGRDRPKDALAALEGLELFEPKEARWPHRKGDVLRRLGKTGEAEESYLRAVKCYVAQGFFTRAVALAKMVVDMNPERAGVLDELHQEPAQQIKAAVQPAKNSILNPKMPPPPRLPSGTMQAVTVRAVAAPIPREEPLMDLPKASRAIVAEFPTPVVPPIEDREPSSIAGVRVDHISVVASAMGLTEAKDADEDEIRFEDVPEALSVDIDVSELEDEPRPTLSSSPELEVTEFGDEEAPTAVRLALMSASSLFVDVPRAAMSAIVQGAELVDLAHGTRVYRRGEIADGLYVVVEGKADLVLGGAKKKLVVGEGSVFGEDALLEGAMRNGNAWVNGRLLALKIRKDTLDALVTSHTALGDVLFNLLVRRLVTMALQTSALFTVFDIPTRKELARLFEVRRAIPGTIIKQKGKRSDGLYLPLAGEFEVDDGKERSVVPLGTMFGHASLLTDAPADRTVRTRRESVVLRLPAARFLAFAARIPEALPHLTALAREEEGG